MTQTMVPDERALRESVAPWPQTAEELSAYIASLVEREHDYGTCVYAMSLAATATFQYVAKRLGVTGFQASCADMDILARTRGYKNGFIILNAADLLYPQYDLRSRVDEWIEETLPRLAKVARERLAESEGMHPSVRAHMERIAALPDPAEDGQ